MGRARGAAILAGAAVALLSCVGALAVLPADARNEPSEQDFVARVNDARATAGRGALAVAADLVDVARRHSQRMASERRLYHNPNVADEVSNWQALGETVGTGGEVGAVHDAFMRSQVHRDDILDARFTQIGVGVVWDGSTLWVTEIFRQPQASSPAPAPAPAPAPQPEPAPAPRSLAATPPPAPAPAPAPAPVAAPVPPAPAPAPASAPAPVIPAPPPAAPVPPQPTSVGSVAAATSAGEFVLGVTHERAAMPVPAGIPRIPVPVGIASGLLSFVVAMQGVVVRRLGLA